MKILLIDDDALETEAVRDALVHYFPEISVDIVNTERGFRDRLKAILDSPPDLVILDVMLRWSDASSEPSAPPNELGDFASYRSGLRCHRLLAQNDETKNIPTILYTVLERGDIAEELRNMPQNVVYLKKESDSSPLIRLTRSLLQLKSQMTFSTKSAIQKVFLVHGHDEESKETAARFVERLGLIAVILNEQTSAGRTIIEKFERHSEVSFALVLLTPDDVGATKGQLDRSKSRARQNVIFELGYFLGKLGRERVCALYKGEIEIPSDYNAVIYIPMDSGGAWRLHLAREMKAAGLNVDLNKVLA
jgi:predicted nucleotide-binding protein